MMDQAARRPNSKPASFEGAGQFEEEVSGCIKVRSGRVKSIPQWRSRSGLGHRTGTGRPLREPVALPYSERVADHPSPEVSPGSWLTDEAVHRVKPRKSAPTNH
jgi:hypothetical protein